MAYKPVFEAKHQREFSSYNAGAVFGRLYATKCKNLSAETVERIVSSLKPSDTKFDPDFYKLGFEHELRAGNRLPVDKSFAERVTKTMGKLSNAKKEVTGGSGFVKIETIVSQGNQTFCIRNIGSHNGNFGMQWDLQVLIDPMVAGDEESEEAVPRTLTIPQGKNPNSRDQLLRNLIGKEPIHNVTFRGIDTPRGLFYDFDELPGTCVCGVIEDDEPA